MTADVGETTIPLPHYFNTPHSLPRSFPLEDENDGSL
jgi:hypothetical protein